MPNQREMAPGASMDMSEEEKPSDKDRVHNIVETARVSTTWSGFRVRGSFATLAICVVLGLWWGWIGGFVLAALAGVAFIDADRRRRRSTENLIMSVMLDMTLIGLGIVFADLEPAGVGAAYVYMMAVPLLLLPASRAVWVMAYGTVWAVLALSPISLFPIPPHVNRSVATAIVYAIFTGLLLSLIAVLSRSLRSTQKAAERRLKGEVAVAIAGKQLLLSHVHDDALIEALEAIREATGAETAFVAENTGDRRTGPAAVVRQVSGDPGSISNSTSMRWTLPYMQHREPAAALARGEAVRLDEALGIVLGRNPGTVFALAVPISVGGEWAGFLGIAHNTSDGSTPDPDLHVLETTAAMIGAFLEREQAYERLEQLVHSKDRFLASVSHEIRTPLTSVVGFASVLRDDPDQLGSEEGAELVGLILQQAQEVSDLVEDLLVAARAEIDAVTVTKEPVHLGKEIERVLAARVSGEKDIFVAASPSHRALADPTRVRQIIRNLVTNALRYGGHEITITTHRDGGDVTLVFSDNGEGIPNEYRRRIFDPYYRGESGTAQPQSIGLGLAVSRQLARLMDGDLTLRSDLGPATFQLTLPLAPKDKNLAASDAPSKDAVMVGEEAR